MLVSARTKNMVAIEENSGINIRCRASAEAAEWSLNLYHFKMVMGEGPELLIFSVTEDLEGVNGKIGHLFFTQTCLMCLSRRSCVGSLERSHAESTLRESGC